MANDFLNVALQFLPLLAILLFANWGERLRQQGRTESCGSLMLPQAKSRRSFFQSL